MLRFEIMLFYQKIVVFYRFFVILFLRCAQYNRSIPYMCILRETHHKNRFVSTFVQPWTNKRIFYTNYLQKHHMYRLQIWYV